MFVIPPQGGICFYPKPSSRYPKLVILSGARSAKSKDPEAAHSPIPLTPFSHKTTKSPNAHVLIPEQGHSSKARTAATVAEGQRPDSYQPGVKPQVCEQTEPRRAESPIHSFRRKHWIQTPRAFVFAVVFAFVVAFAFAVVFAFVVAFAFAVVFAFVVAFAFAVVFAFAFAVVFALLLPLSLLLR
ncbi:hypothetical protein [Edaphobacter acidisoli]|uniref:hypothetical protein n=1 Tax=Edaphobacter acidisoli TaxID=2040573 RepID=UPI00166DA10A|nr:hypothetical protein [Edaphobacter acidisoli]